MFNFQAVGFVVILGIVALGVDYHQQSQKAQTSLSELSAGAYIQTITGRFAEVKQAKADKAAARERAKRQHAGARVYLPEAPEGWTRRAWADGDNSTISKAPRELQDFENEAINSNAFLKQMHAKNEQAAAEKRNAQIWVYERGDEIVSVRARFTPGIEGNSITANAMAMVADNMNLMSLLEGWGVVQGVAFGTYKSFASPEDTDYTVLSAVIGFGDEVRLDVRSTASDEATREILNLLDYDGMNALLSRPMGHVGGAAPQVDMALQKPLADKMIALRQDLIRERSQASEEWLRSAASPGESMTLALRQAGFGIEGAMGEEDARLAETKQQLEQRAYENMLTNLDKEASLKDADMAGENTATADTSGDLPGATGLGGSADATPVERAAPTRLQLSGGKSCLDGGLGSFCKK